MRLRLRGLRSMAARKHGEARAARKHGEARAVRTHVEARAVRKHEARLRDRQAQGDVQFRLETQEIRD